MSVGLRYPTFACPLASQGCMTIKGTAQTIAPQGGAALIITLIIIKADIGTIGGHICP
jgi:hypothetical protein